MGIGFKDIFCLDVHPNFVGKMIQFFSGRCLKWIGEPTITERIMFEPEPSTKTWNTKSGWVMLKRMKCYHLPSTISLYWVVVSNMFYFHLYLGNMSNLTNIFEMG